MMKVQRLSLHIYLWTLRKQYRFRRIQTIPKHLPNPTSGIVYVSQENEGLTQVKVYTILGKEIYSNILLNSLKIDLSSKSNGVYFIEFSNGEEKIIERLILNR